MPDKGKVAAIILAAGASQRFGSDKLSYPLTRNGLTMPLAAHSLLPWLQHFVEVTVVVRPQQAFFCAAIETALGETQAAAIRWVECADAGQGMGRSLACGVRENHDCIGWVIGLADMPALPAQAIADVRMALIEGALLAAASSNGRRGHPVGFAAQYREPLLALQGDTGARQLLERDHEQLKLIETNDPGIFTDVDSMSDVHRIAVM